MFWKGNNASSSQIEAVLAKEDVTLQELMDEDDIINECKLQNKSLIDFLIKPKIIEDLVTLITIEPSLELDEHLRFKYPNIACEILTCDVPALNERLASDEALLAKLYVFLDSEPPLNPLLASFFSKIMGVLITKKTEQVLDFLKAKDNFITLLLKHLGTSAIMDLTLKLMTQVEGVEVRQNILNWLDSQRIMQSLVSLLDPEIDKERHYNVSQLLCDFIRISRDTQRNCSERNDPDPLLNTLESPETISLLLDHMLKEKDETAIVGGIQVLLTLLEINKNINCDNINDTEQKQTILQNTTLTVLKRLKEFHNLLLEPPKKTPISTTIGLLDPPLGNTRLQVAKLIAAIISTNNAELMKELVSLGTLNVLLDLFFNFPWNNFLHTQVELCIISSLKIRIPSETGDDNALYQHLLVNCKLIERVLDAWKENDEQQSESKGVRKGYMGHLTSIANSIGSLISKTTLGQFMTDNLPEVTTSFNAFTESTLQEINNTRAILLGGVHPNVINEDDEYGDTPYAQPNILHQQMYTQYQFQMQNLSTRFIENYGFNDDDFNDGDDALQSIDHRTNINFDLSEGDLVQQHELFKQVCDQNISTLDDVDDQIFEERDHTFQTVIEKQGKVQDEPYSSDSDEGEDSPTAEDPFMDIDSWSTTKDVKCLIDVQEDPWGQTKDKMPNEDTSWADFSTPSFANFEANFDKCDTDANATAPKADPAAAVDEPESKRSVEEGDKTADLKDSINNLMIDTIAQAVTEAVDGPEKEAAPKEESKANAMKEENLPSQLERIDTSPEPGKANV